MTPPFTQGRLPYGLPVIPHPPPQAAVPPSPLGRLNGTVRTVPYGGHKNGRPHRAAPTFYKHSPLSTKKAPLPGAFLLADESCEEVLGFFLFGICEDILGGTLFPDNAVFHKNNVA